MNTKDWTIGHYPKTPDKKPSSLIEVIKELELFNHKSAAKILREQLVCSCGEKLGNPEIICDLHPNIKLRTREEKAAFATAWDERVENARN